jgi:hypothetical protein
MFLFITHAWERTLLACPTLLPCYRLSSARTHPLRALSRHNVTHQNSPFSTLRAASLSVAALNTDDTTISMSSNVIIFMVNLCLLPSGSSRRTPPMWRNVAQGLRGSVQIRAGLSAGSRPKAVPMWGRCGALRSHRLAVRRWGSSVVGRRSSVVPFCPPPKMFKCGGMWGSPTLMAVTVSHYPC